MICNGGSRGGPYELAVHLQRTDTNEEVELLETRGVISQGITGALDEFGAIASGSRCIEYLYHANIDPPKGTEFSERDYLAAADLLEKNLRLSGHQRVIVRHRKDGRSHLHVVWNRVNVDTMRSVKMSWDYIIHEQTSRQLEIMHGLPLTPGRFTGREKDIEAPKRARPAKDVQQEQRTGVKREAVVVILNEAWDRSDDGRSYAAALAAEGWTLARGDRRGFIAIDPKGGAHSLSRFIDGVDTKAIARRFEDLDRDSLPNAGEVRERQRAVPAAEAEVAADRPDAAEIAPPVQAAPEAPAPVQELEPAEPAQDAQERDGNEKAVDVAEPAQTAQEPHQQGLEPQAEREGEPEIETGEPKRDEPSPRQRLKDVSLADLAEEMFMRQQWEHGKPQAVPEEPLLPQTPLLDKEAEREEPEERRRRLAIYAQYPALATRHEAELRDLLTGGMARQWTQQSAQAQKRIDWQAQHDSKLLMQRHEAERAELHETHAQAAPRRGALGKLWQGVRKLVTPGRVAAEERSREQDRAADWRRLDMRQDREKAARAAEVQKQKADERSRLEGMRDLAKRDLARRQRDERERLAAGKSLEPSRNKERGRGDRGKGGWER